MHSLPSLVQVSLFNFPAHDHVPITQTQIVTSNKIQSKLVALLQTTSKLLVQNEKIIHI